MPPSAVYAILLPHLRTIALNLIHLFISMIPSHYIYKSTSASSSASFQMYEEVPPVAFADALDDVNEKDTATAQVFQVLGRIWAHFLLSSCM